MLNRNQEIINEYFDNLYHDLLTSPCVLTSIVIPSSKTNNLVNIIGKFNPGIKKNQADLPVISINYIDENTTIDLYEDLKDIYLSEVKNTIKKIIENSNIYYSLSLDYRLLNDEIINLLKIKYQESKYTLRIIGENYYLDSKTYEKISFIDEIIVNDKEDDTTSTSNHTIIINNNLVIDNIIPNRGYDPINEFYITKELSPNEYSLVIDKINNTISTTRKLFIRIYNPDNYEYIIDNINKNKLNNDVEINFLGNPLSDTVKQFEYLKNCPNKITITYTTNEERLSILTKEPYSDNAHIEEELECNGKLSLTDYLGILYSIEFIQKKSKILELSPLEKLIYVYRYIEKNSKVLCQNKITREESYINKYSYANLFSIILRKLQVPCYTYHTSTKLKNISRIYDKKYKIDRLLITDITSDIETNRFSLYKIYSFSYFGLSPIDTLKSIKPDIITLPATLAITSNTYNEYANYSYNYEVKKNNLTKNTLDYSLQFLKLIGYDNVTKSNFYSFISNLISENSLEPLDEAILESAVSLIVEKEINDSRVNQKKFEIDNAVSSNRIGRSEFTSSPKILLKENTENPKYVSVNIIESKNKNEEFNHQKNLFITNSDKLIKDIYNQRLLAITSYKSCDNYISTINNAIIELYNNQIDYPLFLSNNRKRVLKILYDKYETKLYKQINKNLYEYLKDEIIRELEYIKNSKEFIYISSRNKDNFNYEEFVKNYDRLFTKIKYLLDKLSNQKSKKLGVKYKYENDTLSIIVDNPYIKEYYLEIIPSNIRNLLTEDTSPKNNPEEEKTPVFILNSVNKIPDYIEVYLDKLSKYNNYIDNINNIISTIENFVLIPSNQNRINEWINHEKSFSKLEEQLFKYKIELSNFRNTFFTKFSININSISEVKNYKLKDYSYKKDYTFYNTLLNKIEDEIINIASRNTKELNHNLEIKELLNLVDHIISYTNRFIINMSPTSENTTLEMEHLYNRKNSILEKISKIDSIQKGLNIIIKNKKINISTSINKINMSNSKQITIDILKYLKLKNNIKIKLSNQLLNRLRKNLNN